MKHLLLALPLLVAACVQPVASVEPGPEPDLCKASGYQGLVGQSRAVLSTMLLPAGSRVIGPNDAVTADFQAERLNIEIDQSDRIAKVACY